MHRIRVQSQLLMLASLVVLATATAWAQSKPTLPPERTLDRRPDSLAAPFLGVWKSDVDPSVLVTIKSYTPGIASIYAYGRFSAFGFVAGDGLHCVTRSPGSGPGVGPNERFGALRVRGAREGVLAAEFVDDSAVTAPRHETWKLIERPGQWGTAPERTPRPATEPPAPAPADSNPKVGEYVYVEELPEAIERPAPDYPAEARRAGVEGTVIVQALVGRDGRVKDARIVKTVPGLDEAAEACVRRWRFKPAMSKGQPVAVWVAIPVKFTLK